MIKAQDSGGKRFVTGEEARKREALAIASAWRALSGMD